MGDHFDYIECMTRQHSIKELLLAVKRLPPRMPASEALHKSGYDTHQDHIVGWLQEYNGPGFYGRSDTTISDARTVYQRFACAPALLWLLEAAGESPPLIRATIREMEMRGNGRAQTEAKIVRDRHPWERAAQLLFRQ
jgi:hypothetical protein